LRGSEAGILIAGQGQVKLKPHESNQSSAGPAHEQLESHACQTGLVLPHIRPMRLRLVEEPFDDPDYIFELQHDGFPDVTYIYAGECNLIGEGEDLFERKRRSHCGPISGGASLPAMDLSLTYDQVSSFSSVTCPTCGV
jgi:hypothetical protein